MRIFLSFLFSIAAIFGGIAQSESDSLTNEKVSFVRYSLDASDLLINDIEVDYNNKVLVASDKMLITIGHANEQPMKYLEGKNLTSVTFDKRNNIYAAGGNSLYLLTEGIEAKIDAEVAISDIGYHAGKIWVATDNGLYSYIIGSKKWVRYDSSNSKLKSNVINFIKVDDNDIIWIGTKKGYLKIKDGDWSTKDKKYNVLNSRSNKEGQWMVSNGDMWLIDPFNRKYDVGLDKSLYSGEINDFVIDSKGRLYMASDLLVRYNPYKEEIEQYGADVGLLSEKCLALACDKNNNIWIGTADAGLFRILFDDIVQEQITAAVIVQNAISCNNSQDGILKLSVSGGVKPYKYKWSEPNVKGINPSGLKAGSYAVTVSDKFGSQYVAQATLPNPEPIEITVEETSRLTGFGKKDGMARVSAIGGSGKLTYNWSNGSSGALLDKVKAGIFTVSVTDENRCKVTERVEVKREKFIPELDVAKVEIGKKLRINELNFLADSTRLEIDNFEILDEVYDFLVANPRISIEIGGHTNTIPPHSYCDELSTKRAKNVALYIIERGIDASRVQHQGYGKREPITESKTASARKKNQRVEVKILTM